MDPFIIQALMNLLLSIMTLLLIFSYRRNTIKVVIIVTPLAINALLIPYIINNYLVTFIIQILLLIGYFLLVIINAREIKSFMYTVINKQIEPTYKGFLKGEAVKYQLICFFSFLLSPWFLYPVLFYTSYKFYNSFRKPLSKKEFTIFICYNLIMFLAPIILIVFKLDYNSNWWVLYFCTPELLYPSDMKISDLDK
jgi:hypothetical protein